MLLSKKEKDKTYSIGIDASLSNFGVYCYPLDSSDDWYGWASSTKPSDGNDTQRVLDLADDCIRMLDCLDVRIAVFEDYGPINKTAGKVTARAEMCGIVKNHLLRNIQVPIILVSPTALKNFGAGNGKASKDDMVEACHKFGYYPPSHDEADAFHAARLGTFIVKGLKVGVEFTRINPKGF